MFQIFSSWYVQKDFYPTTWIPRSTNWPPRSSLVYHRYEMRRWARTRSNTSRDAYLRASYALHLAAAKILFLTEAHAAVDDA